VLVNPRRAAEAAPLAKQDKQQEDHIRKMRNATYLDFPLAEYEVRFAMLRDKMQQARLDAVLLTMRDNVEYLSGFTTPSWRVLEKRFWLLVPLEREPVLFIDPVHEINAAETSPIDDVRIWGSTGKSLVQQLADVCRELRLDRATIGMELGMHSMIHVSINEFLDLKNTLSNVTFINADEIVGRARMIKSAQEIERIRKAAEITCAGIEFAFRSVREGMTERDVIASIVGEWLRVGGDSAYNATNYGYLAVQAARVLQMTPSPVDRKIQKGDLVQVDGGAVYRGYCADIYRNAVVDAEPSQALKKYAEGCNYIHSKAMEAIKPGVTSAEICNAAEAATHEIGFERYRRFFSDAISAKKGSMIGHGLGFSLHEYPLISPSDETAWVENMCGALEIAFGDDEVGYVEWEDDFVVTAQGVQVTSPFPKELWIAE
jgi:Xaa-Pro dipeptidase